MDTLHPAVARRAQQETDLSLRILVLAPTSNDATLTARFLAEAGLSASVCTNISSLAHELREGCGAALLAEESLAGDAMDRLAVCFETQPPWSDLPVILITRSGGTDGARPRVLSAAIAAGNISIIERPVRPQTLVSACEVALRSRRRQYQVRDLLDQLRAGDRRKDEFLAMLAHELRNPLAAVANAAVLLQSPELEERDWASGVIQRQSGQLAHLIDDLLDVSRITTGKIRLKKQVVDVAPILDRARDSVWGLIKARGHTLDHDYEAGVLWIDADPTRAEQIFLNLLTNAAKYTPPGGRIHLQACRWSDEIRITVQDNGMGIAPHRLPEMFQLFSQGERSAARAEGGLGIGLTIVQRLLELHGGRIDASSEGPNRGSTFTACFPAVQRPAFTGTRVAPPQPSRRRRVLIVDDNVDTAEAMARLLNRAGHDTVVVHDGQNAITRARAISPDAVIMDIGLPEMDGYEVATRMGRDLWRETALLIAVTGYGQADDRQRAFEAGFDHHFTKPVDIAQVQALLGASPSQTP